MAAPRRRPARPCHGMRVLLHLRLIRSASAAHSSTTTSLIAPVARERRWAWTRTERRRRRASPTASGKAWLRQLWYRCGCRRVPCRCRCCLNAGAGAGPSVPRRRTMPPKDPARNHRRELPAHAARVVSCLRANRRLCMQRESHPAPGLYTPPPALDLSRTSRQV